MQIRALGGLAGVALELLAGAAFMIWPNQLWIAWSIFAFGSVLLFGSLGWWFFTNYHLRSPVIARASNGNIVESRRKAGTNNPIGSFGDFSDFKCTSEDFSLGENHGVHERFLKISLTFQFHKKTRPKTKVDATMRATRYTYTGSRIKQKLGSYEWVQSDTTPRSEMEIPIAYIPRRGDNPGVYGDKKIEGYFLADKTAHYIEVELHSEYGIQRKTVQIIMPYMDLSNVSFDQPRDVTSNRFLVFLDSKLSFPDEGRHDAPTDPR